MTRKHNLDKVSNHIMLETDLSDKDRDKLLDVVEAQINQNNNEQRRIITKITKRCKTYADG